jgi:hypothetical protein
MQHLPSSAEQLAVRDRLLRQARRALPVLALALLAAVVAVLASAPGEDEVAADRAGSSATTQPGAVAEPGAVNGGAVDGGTVVPGAANGLGAPVPGAGGGVARSGVACTPGARQVTWSAYAPTCVAAFSGTNGGATAPGVTADAVTLSYRRQNTAQAAAVRALAGEATPIDSQYLHDLQVFVNLVNRDFELWGREIRLAPFDGRGDYLTEDLGQGQQAAAADAITARSSGAFADVTFPSATSLFYSSALQSQRVISYGFPFGPQRWYEQNAPWQYNWFLSGSTWAGWARNVVCQRLGTGPADFAGDAALRSKPRVYGIVAVEFPTWLDTADEIVEGIEQQCGIRMARRASYTEDLGSLQQDASAIAAQMRAAGVTTLMCFCDPLMPIFLTDAASRQDYRPEWIVQNQFDPIAQVVDQTQFANAIAPGPSTATNDRSEAYAAYKLADPRGEPASIYYQAAYATIVHLAAALQAAGPNVNPETFRAGVFAHPGGTGDFGVWGGGAGRYTPTVAVSVVRWSPKARGANGAPGSWRPCDGDHPYPVNDPKAWGSGPLRCPG